MDRINCILKNKKYAEYLLKNKQCEIQREFCKHDINHHLDVARIAYILAVENNLQINKEVVYAAGLLHDIGRWKEYQQNIDHATAGADLAGDILKECGFDREERHQIVKAIKEHRNEGVQNTYLSVLLCRSDKFSRYCIGCKVIDKCKRFADKDADSYKLLY